MRDRLRALADRVPRRAWLILGALGLFLGGFGVTVGPLLFGGNLLRAEVTGRLPGEARVGQMIGIELSLDNVGDIGISPLCVVVGADGDLGLQALRIQGTDTQPFQHGRACGGRLNAQEAVSLLLTAVPRTAGTFHVTVTAARGEQTVGPPLTGTIAVLP